MGARRGGEEDVRRNSYCSPNSRAPSRTTRRNASSQGTYITTFSVSLSRPLPAGRRRGLTEITGRIEKRQTIATQTRLLCAYTIRVYEILLGVPLCERRAQGGPKVTGKIWLLPTRSTKLKFASDINRVSWRRPITGIIGDGA